MEIFQQLGRTIEERWRAENYLEESFPDLAAKALAEVQLARNGVTPWDIIRWSHSESQLPRQLDIEGRFGNPPITLYCGSRFFVDIYFWLDGTTDIHQHSFAGAFQVLVGSSIHSRYEFQQEQAINEHFLLGRIDLKEVELLTEGDIRPIIPGPDHIHSLFHLDRPSCTITVRTFALASRQPQYSYRKPSVATNPFYQDASFVRKLQTLTMLLNLQPPGHDELILELLAISDLQTTYSLLLNAAQMLGSSQIEEFFQLSTGQNRFASLMEQARLKHGKQIDYLLPVLIEAQRQDDIVRRRQFITSNDHRFFLALLLNIPSTEKILELVKSRFPNEEPLDKVLDWVMELSQTKLWGSKETNVLGLNDFDDDHLFVLECLMKRLSRQAVKDKLAADYPADYAARLDSQFDEIAAALRKSIPFKAMLAGDESSDRVSKQPGLV